MEKKVHLVVLVEEDILELELVVEAPEAAVEITVMELVDIQVVLHNIIK